MIKKIHEYNLAILRSPITWVTFGAITEENIIKDSLLNQYTDKELYHLVLIAPYPYGINNYLLPFHFLSPDLNNNPLERPSGKYPKETLIVRRPDNPPKWTGIGIKEFFKKQNDSPVRVGGRLHIFQKIVYDISEPEIYEPIDNIKALILAKELKWQKKIEKSKRISTLPKITEPQRSSIPDDVKMFVWRRDGGGCVKCGSQEKLEFDHIIPISKGGSNTARNIQILCEKCNREKGDNIY